MITETGAILEKEEIKAQCSHHWIIEPASGPVSQGVCKLCGAEKQFDNLLEDTTIDKYDATAFARLVVAVNGITGDSANGDKPQKRRKAAASLN